MGARRIPIVGPIAAGAYRRLPRERRLRGLEGFRPKRVLQLRRMVPGADRIPLTVRSPEGIRLRFTDDPLDETIAEDVFGRHRATYFPDVLGDLEPALVLDLGAHHGQYSLLATVAFPHAEVIAVEPGPKQAAALRRNVELNGLEDRITVRQVALAEGRGRATLHLDPSGSWGNTLFRPATATDAVPVETATLADLLDGRRPDVIKCNAEGAEFALVDQLAAIDPRPRLLVLMVHAEHGDVEALRDAVADLGYRVTSVMVGDHPTWHCTLER